MSVYRFDPLQDARWGPFLDAHPSASIFHSTPWLRTLQRSYGYQPIAYTTSPADRPLRNALVFCRVRSWLTGSRLVSLPFSDHCEPLLDRAESLSEIVEHLQTVQSSESWRYVEIRPLQASIGDVSGATDPSESFVWQSVDLRRTLESIFSSFHKSCVQRNVRRAERKGVSCTEGRSPDLLQDFYQLSILTRRRHGLPPQPFSWFRHLLDSLGDLALIRVARYGGEAIAAILTLRFKHSLVYKYGCSDERYHHLGAMPLLFWNAIQAGKEDGALVFDLGRSEVDNPGLIHFKENFGATSLPLYYYRLPAHAVRQRRLSWTTRIARDVLARMPGSVLTATSRLLYRHLG